MENLEITTDDLFGDLSQVSAVEKIVFSFLNLLKFLKNLYLY